MDFIDIVSPSRNSSCIELEFGKVAQCLARRAGQDDLAAVALEREGADGDRDKVPAEAEKPADFKHRKQRVVLAEHQLGDRADPFVLVFDHAVAEQPARAISFLHFGDFGGDQLRLARRETRYAGREQQRCKDSRCEANTNILLHDADHYTLIRSFPRKRESRSFFPWPLLGWTAPYGISVPE